MQFVNPSHVILEAGKSIEASFIRANWTSVSQKSIKFFLYIRAIEVNIVSCIQQIASSQVTKRLNHSGKDDFWQVLTTNGTFVLLAEDAHSRAALVTNGMFAKSYAINFDVFVANDTGVDAAGIVVGCVCPVGANSGKLVRV